MTPKPKSIRSYWLTIAVAWVLLGAAAAVYAHMKSVPAGIAVPVGLAFLIEFPFYLLPGFPAARARFIAQGKPRAALVFALSAILPWMIYAQGTGHFNFPALVVMISIAVLMNFWFIAFPANPVTDLVYLSLFAAIILLKVFVRVYPTPWPKIETSVLGHIMLVRVMAFSFVAIRGGTGSDYRFIPNQQEIRAGLRWFAISLPAVAAVYWGLGLVTLRTHPLNPGLAVGTFFGILWLVSLSEEFIFRGLLQPWIEKWISNSIVAVIATSLLFGSVHLSATFHGGFPNWRYSIAAATLGLFCGLARRQTGGIQAGMILHALTVAVWKTFLQ